ncbi:unnamed protein product, partial [Laminaria digitata]
GWGRFGVGPRHLPGPEAHLDAAGARHRGFSQDLGARARGCHLDDDVRARGRIPRPAAEGGGRGQGDTTLARGPERRRLQRQRRRRVKGSPSTIDAHSFTRTSRGILS